MGGTGRLKVPWNLPRFLRLDRRCQSARNSDEGQQTQEYPAQVMRYVSPCLIDGPDDKSPPRCCGAAEGG